MNNMLEDLDEGQFALVEDDEDFDEDDEAAPRRSPVFRQPVPRLHGAVTSRHGVSTATLNTPAGNARLQLPTAVVSLETFNETVTALKAAHNQLATQVSANRDGIKKVSEQTTALESSTKKVLKRERKRARESSMMGTMMSMMMTQQLSARIDQIEGAPASTANPMLGMLPLMMMMDDGSGGGGGMGGNNMMMMMMMMPMLMAPAATSAGH